MEGEITSGEGSRLEFKSTLRWNIRAAKNDPTMTLEVLSTIAAFLNSNGGVLLIGVQDDGSLHGIDSDGYKSDDQFVVALFNFLRAALGADVASYINPAIVTLKATTICRVEVAES